MSRDHVFLTIALGFGLAGPAAGQCNPVAVGLIPLTLSCDPQPVYITPSASAAQEWNIVALKPLGTTINWDLQAGSVWSTAGGGGCDYLIANGNNTGTVAATTMIASRISASGNAKLQYASASTISLCSPHTVTLPAGTIAKVYQFDLPTAMTFYQRLDIMVNGPSAYSWNLHAPGTGVAWRPRSEPLLEGGGAAGEDFQSFSSLPAGTHAIVIFPTPGDFSFPGGEITITVTLGTTGIASLHSGAIVTTASSCYDFELSSSTGGYHVVAVSGGASNCDLGLGPVFSNSAAGTLDFVVHDTSTSGDPSIHRGMAVRRSGSDDQTIQYDVTTPLTTGTPQLVTVPAGGVLTSFSFYASVHADIGIFGEGPLKWALFDGAGSSGWVDRSAAIATGDVHAGIQSNVAPAGGTYVLVIFRETPDPASDSVYVYVLASSPYYPNYVNLYGPGSSVTLPVAGSAAVSVVHISPVPGEWNGVGAVSSGDYDVFFGEGVSGGAGNTTKFVLFDGNAATMSPDEGIVRRNGAAAEVEMQQAIHTSVPVPVSLTAAWDWSHVLRIFEFNATTNSEYRIGVGGPASGLEWRLFDSGGSAWIDKGDAIVTGVWGQPVDITLQPGQKAIVVYRATGTSVSGTITVSVDPPNPTPTISNLSPTSHTIGNTWFILAVSGSSFIPGAEVRWDGTPLNTTFISSTSLTAYVPNALVNVPAGGTVDVTVLNPAPGGGTSASLPFALNNAVPVLTGVSPNTSNAGVSSLNITATGSGFQGNSTIRLNGNPVATNHLSSTQLSAIITASYLASGGTINVTVLTPSPGGGTSATRTVTVYNPAPTLTNLSPSSVPAGSPAFTLLVTGTGFVPTSQIRLDGTPVPTMFISPTQLSAQIAAGVVAAAGSHPITIVNPAPSGGTSASATLTAIKPYLSSVVPTVIPVMTAASPPITLTLSATGFTANAVMYANGQPLTTVANTGIVTCTLPPTVLQTQLPGGIALTLANSVAVLSNSVALIVGGGTNAGTIIRAPLQAAPGQPFSVVLDGGVPAAPVTMVIDLGNPAPITGFPTPAVNMVFSVGSSSMYPIIDGIGVFGPPTLVPFPSGPVPIQYILDQSATSPFGKLELPGFVAPNPPLNLSYTTQAGYIDPSSPIGFHLTWARYPDTL